MSASITQYTDLVTSEHADKPNFIATLSALLQPVADLQALIGALPASYDLDTAIGVQLDAVGLWIGQSRYLQTPISDVYFSFDIEGLGFDQGTWQGEFDPTTQLTALPDDSYRVLLRAKIAVNTWDGTIEAAERIWDSLFADLHFSIVIIDNQDMTMDIYMSSPSEPSAVVQALFLGGYLDIRPCGVEVTAHIIISTLVPSVQDLSIVTTAPVMDFGSRTLVGALSIAGTTANVTVQVVTLRTPNPAALTLTGIAPLIVRGSQTFITPNAGTLTISGKTPIRTP